MKPRHLLIVAGLLALVTGCTTSEVARAPKSSAPPAVKTTAKFTIPYVNFADVDVAPLPAVLPTKSPVYAQSLQTLAQRGVAGYAIVQDIVDTHGVPREAQCVEASDPVLAHTAVAIVSQMRFHPGMQRSNAVATMTAQRMVVTLTGKKHVNVAIQPLLKNNGQPGYQYVYPPYFPTNPSRGSPPLFGSSPQSTPW